MTLSSAGALAPNANALLDRLVAGRERADRLVHRELLPERPERTGQWPPWADPSVIDGYRSLGVEQPWIHQVAAAESLWAGSDTVLATSTGSGKSMAFWLPILSAIRADTGSATLLRGRPTAIYICPTKALAADQFAALTRLLDRAGVEDVRAATCDGDTPFEERRWVQQHADIVLTNPDMLHFSILPNHARWVRLLRNLRFVVVDEAHAYRGVFGAHVGAVLRRLIRIARHDGADPTFAMASATTAEPEITASRLLGRPTDSIHVVDDDGSPRGRQVFGLWEPPLLPVADTGAVDTLADDSAWLTPAAADGAQAAPQPGSPTLPQPGAQAAPQAGSPEGDAPEAGPVAGERLPGAELGRDVQPEALPDQARRSATMETADLLADLTAFGARSLAFVRSRRAAESVASATRRMLTAADCGDLQVAAYRGGFLPEERRALEADLRSGALRAVATTNALELGIDVAGLDAVLMAGWPGTRASLWQQAGRAGRSGREGLAVLIARDDPLDSYLVHHPEMIFGQAVEATVFDPENEYVLAPHLCAAAAEVPLTQADLLLFGPATESVLAALTAQGALRRRPTGWYWTRKEQPQQLTDLRGSGGHPVQLVEQNTGRMLGTVDAASAPAQVHPGAVYVHQGTMYLVGMLDLDDGVALLTEHRGEYVTFSRAVTEISVLEVRDERQWHSPAGIVGWHTGSVEVRNQVISFQRRRFPDQEILATLPLDLPWQTLRTTATWWTVGGDVLDACAIAEPDVAGALHAAEHASIGLLPLLATCDRWDIGGVSTAFHPDTERPTVFVYDGYPGGAGFAARGFAVAQQWMAATRDRVRECECTNGCPSCVYSPKCGNGNDPLDKHAAARLLDALVSASS